MDTAEKISFGMFLADSDWLSPLVAIIGSGGAHPLIPKWHETAGKLGGGLA